jgi:hypothetical protein
VQHRRGAHKLVHYSLALRNQSAATQRREARGQRHGGRAHHIGSQTCGIELFNGFAGRYQDLATHVAALLYRCELVFKVNACSARFDHGFHQFECIQHTTETSLCISNDRCEEINIIFTLGPLNLISALESIIDTLNHHRYRIGGIQRLVGIHFTGEVCITRNLPTREINSFQTRFNLLHRLITSQRAQRIDERLGVQQIPELFRATLS